MAWSCPDRQENGGRGKGKTPQSPNFGQNSPRCKAQGYGWVWNVSRWIVPHFPFSYAFNHNNKKYNLMRCSQLTNVPTHCEWKFLTVKSCMWKRNVRFTLSELQIDCLYQTLASTIIRCHPVALSPTFIYTGVWDGIGIRIRMPNPSF